MIKSESISALSASLAKAQGELENASKNANNSHFKSRYADLAELLNTVRPVLSKHGLAVIQMPSFDSGVVSIETLLTHSSGEYVSSICSAPVTKQDAQGVGSAITYLRRYSLAAFCGIAQEDDDGNEATEPKKPQLEPKKPQPLNNEQIDHFINIMEMAVNAEQLKQAFDAAIKSAKQANDKVAYQNFIDCKDKCKKDLAE
jgi:hypothetical protein